MAREQKAKISYVDAKGEKATLNGDKKIAGIVFSFKDVEKPLVFDVEQFAKQHKDIYHVAAVRGLAEKVRDTYAGSDSVTDAMETAEDMIGRLNEGEWLSAREGGGPRMTMLLGAIAEVKGDAFNLDESRAKYVVDKDDDDETKKAKREMSRRAAANPDVARVLERLKAEAAAKRAEKTSSVEAIDTAAL